MVKEPLSSAQMVDPAVDALEITPIHHAVAGSHVEALRLLLLHMSRANELLLGGARAVPHGNPRVGHKIAPFILHTFCV